MVLANRLPGGVEVEIQRKAIDCAGAIRESEIVINAILLVVLEQNSGKLVMQDIRKLRVCKRRIRGQSAAPSKRPAIGPGEVVDIIRYSGLVQRLQRPSLRVYPLNAEELQREWADCRARV